MLDSVCLYVSMITLRLLHISTSNVMFSIRWVVINDLFIDTGFLKNKKHSCLKF